MDIKLMALVATCVLFAACAPPNPDTQTIQPIKNQSETKSTTQLETTQPPAAQQKGTMKTIQDFENIPATQATIKTTKGDITFTLFREAAPLTTANFLSLAKSGFYDGIVFHRVIPDFMAQVGDPFTKDASMQARWGQGGPGYTIADEFGEGLAHDSEGIVSMANAGPNTGGSQFFITYEATPWLDGKHAIFGKVTQGMEVLRQITVGDKIVSISYQ